MSLRTALTALIFWTGLTVSAASNFMSLSPPKLVVEYGAPASANCSTNITVLGMGWEAPLGAVDMTTGVQQLTWKVDSLTEWNIKLLCFIYVTEDTDPMERDLQVTVYKVPESVSISYGNQGDKMIEGKSYELKCKILVVAPVQNLIIKWYKGQAVVKKQNFSENITTPKNVSQSLWIKPTGDDNGANYSCEAQLELGPEGPHPPPRVASSPLKINVHYSPKFSRSEEIFNHTDRKVYLNCTVRANPLPTYSWDTPQGQKFNISWIIVPPRTSGTFKCTASNAYGTANKVFTIRDKSHNRATFWIILVVGLVLIIVLIGGYFIKKKFSSNSVV